MPICTDTHEHTKQLTISPRVLNPRGTPTWQPNPSALDIAAFARSRIGHHELFTRSTSSGLTPAQIGGIFAGILGAVLLPFFLVCLLARRRRLYSPWTSPESSPAPSLRRGPRGHSPRSTARSAPLPVPGPPIPLPRDSSIESAASSAPIPVPGPPIPPPLPPAASVPGFRRPAQEPRREVRRVETRVPGLYRWVYVDNGELAYVAHARPKPADDTSESEEHEHAETRADLQWLRYLAGTMPRREQLG